MANVQISDLTAATTPALTDLIEVEQSDGNSKKETLQQVKTLFGGYSEVSGTLATGSTSITLSDAAITTSSTLDFYTDKFGVNPTNVNVSTGSVTLTFEAQDSALGVKVRIS